MEQYDEPLTVFQDSLPNRKTRDSYERKLTQFFKFLNLEGELKSQSAKFTTNAKIPSVQRVYIILDVL